MTTDDIPTWSPDEACCTRCAHYLPPFTGRWDTPSGCRVLPDPEPGMTITYCLEYTPSLARQHATDTHLDPEAALVAPVAAEANLRGLTDPHAGQGTTSQPRVPDCGGNRREGTDTFFLQENEATK
jgi:hypothetical protein